jgi:hypothetical protein
MMRSALLLLALFGAAAAARGQQPFVSDDAEVTAQGRWHFEYFNEYAALSRNVAPDLRQDLNNFVIQYGLLKNLEVNIDFPIIAIDRAHHSVLGNAFGLGDVDFAAKYKVVTENPGTIRPSFTVIGAVELPTGDKSTQLGSGYTDVVLNTVTQKAISETTVVHLDLGYQFSGNTLTGAIGIRTPGHILTGGLSVAHGVSETLVMGIDLNGAEIRTAHKSDRQLQLTLGGSYIVRAGMTFDFAVLAGWSNSPRVGLVLGTTYSP